ncbi:UNVERIFIED_ORG: DNA repair ATPase RecN [Bacillus sp. B2I3]|nr:DNA repair ATPase RecN [Bacillus sp. B2I3]
MNNSGFYIRKLTLTGANVKPVSVEFYKGLNIISGPSDTGKSYIFESINYMLGSSSEPKKITEAKGYSSILMEILSYRGAIYTLKRNLGKDVVEVYTGSSNIDESSPMILNYKHNKDNTENLSAFLLNISGFIHPSYVLTSKEKSKVRTISFRDLPAYITISEDKIIKTESPILSGQFTKPTVEKAIFKLLVSGFDDSDKKVANEQNVTSVSKLEGQIELIEKLINQEEKELLGLSPKDISTINILDVETKMEEIKELLSIINLEIISQTNERRILWNQIEEDKSRSIAVSELIKRFKLLKENYESDLERLDFIREGNHYFSQLNFSLCPFCNKKLQYSSCNIEKCGLNSEDNTKLTQATEAEINKIKLQLLDLISTIEENVLEYEELNQKITENENVYSEISKRLNLILEPQETNLKELLDSYVIERDNTTRYKFRLAKIDELNKEKTLIENKLQKQPKAKNKTNDIDELVLTAYKDFSDYMERTLQRWSFSSNTTVNFENGIFYVDSKSTKDYGKGYRAIIYSAFVISLMEYCRDKEMPHPGFVVLDSPLTTYKGKKKYSKDDVKGDIQTSFFDDLALIDEDMQVIILENKEPNDEIKAKVNYIEFTKDDNEGRYGLFQRVR